MSVSFSVGQVASNQASNHPTVSSSSSLSQLRAKAEAGDADAQLALGTAYDSGNGITQNDERVVLWYRKAAEQGNAAAQNHLGVMYSTGRGVEKSKESALRWYQEAARQRYATAMFNLGTAYYNGDGVPVDDSKAYAWFLLAEEAGSDAAAQAVKRSEAEIRPYQRIAAFSKIGDMYQNGEELRQDNNEATKWYRRGAQEDDDVAQVKLGSLLMATGGDKASQEARHWCEAAAKSRSAKGAYCMGLLYERGMGAQQDLSQAAKWYGEAGAHGFGLGLLRLGEMYWKGSGVKPDTETAYSFILLASDAGVADALRDKAALEKEMDSKQIEKGRKKAAAWMRTHSASFGLRARPPEK